MQLSILVIDLVGYSERLAALEEQVSNAGATLNRQIEEFVGAAVSAARLELSATVLKFTGDGAILKAPDAERAHRIAIALQEASAQFNRSKQTQLGKRVFRVGIASGDVTPYESTSGSTDHGGSTIGRAARMEAGCKPGGVMMDEDSFIALPQRIKMLYSGPEEITDKNGVSYQAYRWKGACMTRLQHALQKRLENRTPETGSFEAALLQRLPFAKDVASLLNWIALPDHGAISAIEKLRGAILEIREQTPAGSSATQFLVLLFLVCAEQRLRTELIRVAGDDSDLKISLSDESVRNLIAVGMQNCGLHFEIDLGKRAVTPRSIVSELPIIEPGGSKARAVFEELYERERVLQRLHPTMERSAIKLDAASMRARLRSLDETKNIQITMAFAADSSYANDGEVRALLKDLGVSSFHFGVPDDESTIEVKTAREVGEALADQLADLLVMLVPDTGSP